MHIIIQGTTTAHGRDALLTALWAISEDIRLDVGTFLENIQRSETFSNESGTVFAMTRNKNDDADFFRIDGSIERADAETVLRTFRHHSWTSIDDDQFGPILRGECTFEEIFRPRTSLWPRPSSRPRSDPPKPTSSR